MKKFTFVFALFVFFVFLSPVFASVTAVDYQSEFVVSDSSCSANYFPPYLVNSADLSTSYNYYNNNSTCKSSYLIPVSPGDTFTIRLGGNSTYYNYPYIAYFTSSTSAPSSLERLYSRNTFTIPNDIHFIAYKDCGSAWNLNNYNYMLASGTIEQSYVAYEACPPPTPTPTDSAPISEFISIYASKISFLANSFTTNPYLFSFIVIILAWVTLELFLRLFHLKGGYKK